LGSSAKENGRQWLWRKSASATSIISGAFGLLFGPQSFNCIIPPFWAFLAFLALKNKAGVFKLMLEVAINLSVIAGVQGRLTALPPPTSSHRLITPPPPLRVLVMTIDQL
jgi:hypothetical protein